MWKDFYEKVIFWMLGVMWDINNSFISVIFSPFIAFHIVVWNKLYRDKTLTWKYLIGGIK